MKKDIKGFIKCMIKNDLVNAQSKIKSIIEQKLEARNREIENRYNK